MKLPLPIMTGAATFAGIGVLILYLALLDIVDNWRFMDGAIQTEGTVKNITSHTTETGTSNNRRYGTSDLAFIRFKDASGAIISFEHSYGLLENAFEPGDSVTVAYPENQSYAARVATFGALWAAPIAMVVCGGMFVVAGLALYRVFGRTRF